MLNGTAFEHHQSLDLFDHDPPGMSRSQMVVLHWEKYVLFIHSKVSYHRSGVCTHQSFDPFIAAVSRLSAIKPQFIRLWSSPFHNGIGKASSLQMLFDSMIPWSFPYEPSHIPPALRSGCQPLTRSSKVLLASLMSCTANLRCCGIPPTLTVTYI